MGWCRDGPSPRRRGGGETTTLAEAWKPRRPRRSRSSGAARALGGSHGAPRARAGDECRRARLSRRARERTPRRAGRTADPRAYLGPRGRSPRSPRRFGRRGRNAARGCRPRRRPSRARVLRPSAAGRIRGANRALKLQAFPGHSVAPPGAGRTRATESTDGRSRSRSTRIGRGTSIPAQHGCRRRGDRGGARLPGRYVLRAAGARFALRPGADS